MKKSIPLAKLVERILPASLVPVGKVLSRFIPWMVDFTADTFDRMAETADEYADEVVVAEPAVSRMYSFPTMT